MNLPNKLTVFRLLLIIPLAAVQLSSFPYSDLAAAVIFSVGVVSDVLDGYLARKNNQQTTFGRFIDPIADKMLVLTALVILVQQGVVGAWGVIVILAREFIISGFRLVAVADGGKVISANWLGKLKTSTQNVAIILLLLGNFPFSLIGLPVAQILYYLSIACTIWSGADYLYQNADVLRHIMEDAK